MFGVELGKFKTLANRKSQDRQTQMLAACDVLVRLFSKSTPWRVSETKIRGVKKNWNEPCGFNRPLSLPVVTKKQSPKVKNVKFVWVGACVLGFIPKF